MQSLHNAYYAPSSSEKVNCVGMSFTICKTCYLIEPLDSCCFNSSLISKASYYIIVMLKYIYNKINPMLSNF